MFHYGDHPPMRHSDEVLPAELVHLWAYLLTAYRTAAFIESCPADQDIIYHYKVCAGI